MFQFLYSGLSIHSAILIVRWNDSQFHWHLSTRPIQCMYNVFLVTHWTAASTAPKMKNSFISKMFWNWLFRTKSKCLPEINENTVIEHHTTYSSNGFFFFSISLIYRTYTIVSYFDNRKGKKENCLLLLYRLDTRIKVKKNFQIKKETIFRREFE